MNRPTPPLLHPVSERDLGPFTDYAARSFNISEDVLGRWLDDVGRDRLYAIRDGSDLVAGCIGFPTGHFLAGQAVSSLGIALVFVAPHRRGEGWCTRLMQGVLRQARSSGTALSSLHPARLSPYRRVGYELAGSLLEHRVDIASLRGIGAPERHIREATDADHDAIEELHLRHATSRHGCLVRERHLWRSVRHHRDLSTEAYIVDDAAGTPRGYFYLRRTSSHADGTYDLHLADVWASDGSSHRAILRFVANHGSRANELRFHGSPGDPLVLELPENHLKIETVDHWMVRLVDVRKALTTRGYHRSVDAAVTLELTDPLFEDNCGSVGVRIEGGVARIEPGKGPSARMSTQTLAPLFTGLYTATQLAASGRIDSTADGLATLDSIFAGPHPHIRLYF